MGISLLMVDCATRMGRTMATMPIITRMLKMLDPTTLPMASWVAPRAADMTEMTSSGAEVPNDTIVRPITSSLTPQRRAMADEPSVRALAPTSMSAKPPMRYIISSIIVDMS